MFMDVHPPKNIVRIMYMDAKKAHPTKPEQYWSEVSPIIIVSVFQDMHKNATMTLDFHIIGTDTVVQTTDYFVAMFAVGGGL